MGLLFQIFVFGCFLHMKLKYLIYLYILVRHDIYVYILDDLNKYYLDFRSFLVQNPNQGFHFTAIRMLFYHFVRNIT